jgi:5-methylcytosine-specific restriction endonuclease McrA
MNVPTGKIIAATQDTGSRHWLQEMPYRAIVPIKRHSSNGPMLYQVAGSTQAPCGSERALKLAVKIHGARCFYCSSVFAPNIANTSPGIWTLDHVEPVALGGKDHLVNLVVACKPCNIAKGHKPIDSFNPDATKKWLTSLLGQVNERLAQIR